MSKLIISLSSPMDGDQIQVPLNSDHAQFQMNLPGRNAWMTDLARTKGNLVDVFGLKMFLVDMHSGSSYIYIKDGRTVFWSSYSVDEDSFTKPIWIGHSVWQDKDCADVKGLSRKFYLRYILHLYRTIGSSSIHRAPGREMWFKPVPQALSDPNMRVWARPVHETKLLQITSVEQFNALKPRLWGAQDAYRLARIFLALNTGHSKPIL